MASSKATGASALLGVAVDAPSDLYAVGRPGIDLTVTAPPGVLTAAAGATGLLTGSFLWRVAYGQKNGALTNPGPYVCATAPKVASGIPFKNDLVASGTPDPSLYSETMTVTIDGITPDTFSWDDGGVLGDTGSLVLITGTAQDVFLGVKVALATTGHHVGDSWKITSVGGVLAVRGAPFLDDLTVSGTPNPSAVGATLTVTIDGVAPDTFSYDDGLGNAGATQAITGSAQLVTQGISVDLAATGHVVGDSWAIKIVPAPTSLTTQKGALSAISISSDPNVDRRVIERSDDGGATWAIAGTIYNNVGTVTFSDNTPTLDKSKVLPHANQTGGNYGFTFLEPDSFDLEPEFSNLKVVALLGTAGSPRAIPGNIKIAGTPKSDLRPADMLPILLAGAGVPDSYTQVAGEPTRIATWAATTGKRNPRTISAFAYQGSPNVPPNFLYQIATDELDFTFANGKIESIAPKFTGTNYGTSAPAVPLSGAGPWAGTFAAIGQRYDANALTDSVFIKITQAWTTHGDPVKFKVNVGTHASAGTGTYGSEYTLYTNATSDNQTKGGLQYNDAIELADQNGLYLGADVGSNRQPFLLVATAPFTTDLHANDIYELLPSAAIPGVGSAPYSGVPARFAQGPRFTDAHITIYQDGNVIEATSGTLKMMWPKKAVSALCAGARTVIDMPNEGFFGANMTISRYLDTTTYRQIIRTDSRAHINIALVGERIPVNPGVLSTYRESLILDFPQVVLESVKAPVPGQVLVVETLTASAEQPDDTSKDLYTMTLTTRQGYRIPS